MFLKIPNFSISEKRTDLMRYFQSRAGKGVFTKSTAKKTIHLVDIEKANFTTYTGAMDIK